MTDFAIAVARWGGHPGTPEWKMGSMVYQGLILLKQTTEDGGQYHHRSYLFTVHWWGEELAEDQAASGGRVRHVASGEARDFRDWSALVGVLLGMLQGLEGGNHSNAKGQDGQDGEEPS